MPERAAFAAFLGLSLIASNCFFFFSSAFFLDWSMENSSCLVFLFSLSLAKSKCGSPGPYFSFFVFPLCVFLSSTEALKVLRILFALSLPVSVPLSSNLVSRYVPLDCLNLLDLFLFF